MKLKKNEKSSKFLLTATEILQQIGGKDNFLELYNCITRVRFKIKDKEKVKFEVLKKLPLVKGVVWNGDELQIIIGAEVENVMEALKKILNANKLDKNAVLVKTPIYRKVLNFVVAVVVPCLPLMFYTGFSSGISALFSSPGIGLTESGWGKSLGELDVFSAFLFLNERVGFMLLGVFFGYNTAKYLNGDLILSLLVSLTLSSGLLMGQNWVLISNIFNTGQNLAIKGYDGSILIFIFASIGFVYLHKWVKTWMPAILSSMFTPLLSVGITLSVAFFLVGPIISLFELMLATGVLYMLDIPYGIGAFFVGLLFQPLVLTGSHMALSSIVLAAMTNPEVGQPSVYYVCVQISAFAQAGAVLGCGIRAKEKNFKASALSTFPITGFFGITEPALYAVNLPKFKPFLAGCVSAGIISLIGGLLGLKMKTYTGNGFFGFLGFQDIMDGVIFLILGFIAIGLATLITCFVYSERKDEYKVFKNSLWKFSKMVGEEKSLILKNSLEEVKKFSIDNKTLEQKILKVQNLNNKIQKNQSKNKNAVLVEKWILELEEIEKSMTQDFENYNSILNDLISKITVQINENNDLIGTKKDNFKNNLISGIGSLKLNYEKIFEVNLKLNN